MNRTYIYGIGGHGREIAQLFINSNNNDNDIFFIDDNIGSHGSMVNGLEVVSFQEALEEKETAQVLVAIGKPHIRRLVTEKCLEAGLKVESLIAADVEIAGYNLIGSGVVINSGAVVTVNCNIGDHVHIDIGATISHDVIIGEYSTICPGVNIAGHVEIGKNCFIGTGVSTINGTPENPLIIGDGAFVGAGACVTQNVAAATTVVGVPARPINRG